MTEPINNLSYSKIGVLDSCHWLFAARYLWHLPSIDVEGNVIGNITHECVEYLGLPKRVEYTKNILAAKKLPASMVRFIAWRLRQEGFFSEKNIKDICTYVGRFIKYDFFFEGCLEVLPPEYRFSLKQEAYKLKGFIDRLAFYKCSGGRYVVIRDAKTQKNNFTDEQMEYSKQALCYLLAVKRLFPDVIIEKSRVEFVMLKFPEDFIKVVENVDESALCGFEEILKDYQKKVDEFTEDDAVTKFEAARGWLKEGEGFGGLRKCGATVKKPGERKADGNLKWVCDCKFPRDYYVLLDSEGKVLTSAKTEKELKPEKGQTVQVLSYRGCYWFNKQNYQ